MRSSKGLALVALLMVFGTGGCAEVLVFLGLKSDATLADYPCDRDRTPPDEVVEDATGGPTYENEVHDCQRLVVDADPGPSFERAFGPLVAIYPIDGAMDRDTGPVQVTAFANIYNWGTGSGDTLSYAPLGISPGWNLFSRT